MATVPTKYVRGARLWLNYFDSIDCHKWIVARETGKGGLSHWQVRFKVRGCDSKEGKTNFFNAWKMRFPQGHIEFTENWCDYERKEGNFIQSDDTRDILSIRFGQCTLQQRSILDILETQNDRQIDVWYDPAGNHGKTWLSLHLYERGLGMLVPRYCATAREISNFVCSAYRGERYIIFDLPRAAKINPAVYETLEEVKDGTVYDPRYSGRMRNIRGVKVLVFTNNKLDEKRLSFDRWRLHGFGRSVKREEAKSPNRNTKGSSRKGRGRKGVADIDKIFGGSDPPLRLRPPQRGAGERRISEARSSHDLNYLVVRRTLDLLGLFGFTRRGIDDIFFFRGVNLGFIVRGVDLERFAFDFAFDSVDPNHNHHSPPPSFIGSGRPKTAPC